MEAQQIQPHRPPQDIRGKPLSAPRGRDLDRLVMLLIALLLDVRHLGTLTPEVASQMDFGEPTELSHKALQMQHEDARSFCKHGLLAATEAESEAPTAFAS